MAAGAIVQLETFANPQPFHPEQLADGSCSQHHFVPLCTRNSQICKEVLQFDGPVHSDRLKPVASLPMPQDHRRPDLVGVKQFVAGIRGAISSLICHRNTPCQNSSIKVSRSTSRRYINCDSAIAE